ncbi:hypothetical protein HK098_000461 [Nowakowskiella sp. JEL0407]|nr:hypothetical protein HK098_000461 [Nowakowskiella sp. JEL0407]
MLLDQRDDPFPTSQHISMLGNKVTLRVRLEKLELILANFYEELKFHFLSPFFSGMKSNLANVDVNILAHFDCMEELNEAAKELCPLKMKSLVLDDSEIDMDAGEIVSRGSTNNAMDDANNSKTDTHELERDGLMFDYEGRSRRNLQILRDQSIADLQSLDCEVPDNKTALEVMRILDTKESLRFLKFYFDKRQNWGKNTREENIIAIFTKIQNSNIVKTLETPSICGPEILLLRNNASIEELDFSDYGCQIKTVRVILPPCNYLYSTMMITADLREDGFKLKLFSERDSGRYLSFIFDAITKVCLLWKRGEFSASRIVLDKVSDDECNALIKRIRKVHGNAVKTGFIGGEYCLYFDRYAWFIGGDAEVEEEEDDESILLQMTKRK